MISQYCLGCKDDGSLKLCDVIGVKANVRLILCDSIDDKVDGWLRFCAFMGGKCAVRLKPCDVIGANVMEG